MWKYSLISCLHVRRLLLWLQDYGHMLWFDCVIYYVPVRSNLRVELPEAGINEVETCRNNIRLFLYTPNEQSL